MALKNVNMKKHCIGKTIQFLMYLQFAETYILVLPPERGNRVFIPQERGFGETFSPPLRLRYDISQIHQQVFFSFFHQFNMEMKILFLAYLCC